MVSVTDDVSSKQAHISRTIVDMTVDRIKSEISNLISRPGMANVAQIVFELNLATPLSVPKDDLDYSDELLKVNQAFRLIDKEYPLVHTLRVTQHSGANALYLKVDLVMAKSFH
jgi:hypothetical protein